MEKLKTALDEVKKDEAKDITRDLKSALADSRDGLSKAIALLKTKKSPVPTVMIKDAKKGLDIVDDLMKTVRSPDF